MSDENASSTGTAGDGSMSIMQRFWSKLAVELGRRAGLVALVGLLVTLVLGAGMSRLYFATGQDSYLNSDDQVAIDNVEYQNLFGGDAMLVMVTADEGKTINDLASPANLKVMGQAAADLRGHPDAVYAVLDPNAALTWTNNLVLGPDGNPLNAVGSKALLAASTNPSLTTEQKAARTANLSDNLARLSAVPKDQQNLDSPQFIDFLMTEKNGDIRKSLLPIFPDKTHMQMVVRLIGNGSLEQGGAGSDLTKQIAGNMKIEGGTVTVVGVPTLLKDINDYLKGGMLQLGAIAVVIMMIILLLLFKVRWRLLPLGVVLLGVIWAFGLAGWLGIPLSIVTIAGLPVMLGIGIDYAIQMHARVEEEVVIDRNEHPIQETARNLGPALLVVTFDAVFAFLALRFAKVPMIRQFGLLLAVGIAVICLCSIIVPLATLGIREYRSPTKGRDFREGPLGTIVVKLGSLPLWTAPVLAILSVAIFAGGIVVEDKLFIQTDPIKWVNQDSQTVQDIDKVQTQVKSASELGIFIETTPITGADGTPGVFSQDTIDFIRAFVAKETAAHPDELLTDTSLVTTVGYVLDVPGGGLVNPTPADVEAAYDVAPQDIQKILVKPEAGASNIVFRYGAADGSLEDRAKVVHAIDDSADPPAGIKATASGLTVVGVGLFENIQSNRIMLTYLSIAFVGIFLALRLRSLVRSLLSLVPVLIAVGLASLVAWAFSLKLSPVTAVGGPLVVAACTEFTSLILLRFIEERRRGLWPRAAIDVTARRTGRAFIVSGLTAIAGVTVLATSSLPLLRDFGIIVGMNVAVALLSALIVLPPLLVWADNHGWVSKHMVPDDVLKATTPKFAGHPEPPFTHETDQPGSKVKVIASGGGGADHVVDVRGDGANGDGARTGAGVPDADRS